MVVTALTAIHVSVLAAASDWGWQPVLSAEQAEPATAVASGSSSAASHPSVILATEDSWSADAVVSSHANQAASFDSHLDGSRESVQRSFVEPFSGAELSLSWKLQLLAPLPYAPEIINDKSLRTRSLESQYCMQQCSSRCWCAVSSSCTSMFSLRKPICALPNCHARVPSASLQSSTLLTLPLSTLCELSCYSHSIEPQPMHPIHHPCPRSPWQWGFLAACAASPSALSRALHS